MTEVVPRASLQARSSSSVGNRHLRSYSSSQAILSFPSALLLAGPSATGAAAGSLVGLPLELLPALISRLTVSRLAEGLPLYVPRTQCKESGSSLA